MTVTMEYITRECRKEIPNQKQRKNKQIITRAR